MTIIVTLNSDGTVTYGGVVWTDQELKDGKGYFIVDEHFMMHYKELKQTVKKLRELVK